MAKDEESGLTYLAVVLGAEEYEGFYYSYVNGKRMFDWAFGAYGYRSVLAPTQVICELPVRLSSTVDFVTLVPKEALYVYLPTETDLAEAVKYSYNTISDAMTAPIEAGEEAGMVTVCRDVQPRKALSPMRVTVPGMVNALRLVHFRKQLSGMAVTPAGRLTSVSAVQPLKA